MHVLGRSRKTWCIIARLSSMLPVDTSFQVPRDVGERVIMCQAAQQYSHTSLPHQRSSGSRSGVMFGYHSRQTHTAGQAKVTACSTALQLGYGTSRYLRYRCWHLMEAWVESMGPNFGCWCCLHAIHNLLNEAVLKSCRITSCEGESVPYCMYLGSIRTHRLITSIVQHPWQHTLCDHQMTLQHC